MQRANMLIVGMSIFVLAPIVLVLGNARRPLTMVDLINVAQLSDARLSPAGDQLLYSLSNADWEKNKRVRHIWRINTDGTGRVQLTNGETSEGSPRWSPDGELIAFLAKRGEDEETQIYVIRNAGGEAYRLTDHETAVSSIQWSPDGERIYFLASDPKSEDLKKREKKKDDVFAFDENYRQRHLWSVSVTDQEEQRITEGNYSIRSYRLSRDGERLAVSRAPTPLFDDSDEAEVWVMDVKGENALRLTENTVSESSVALSPNNEQVLFIAGANQAFETYFNRNLFIVSVTGGPSRLLFPDFPYEIQAARWGKDASTIFAYVNMGLHTELFAIDATEKTYRPLTEGEHTLRNWAYFPINGHHVFSINHRDNPGDIWRIRDNGRGLTQITNEFAYLAQDFRLPRQEKITWQGKDGVEIEGLLFYPLDYQQGQRSPLVVQTHGGPASSDKFGFGRKSNYVSVLAAKGYMVFKPNYRGSTGYGNAFLRDMVGHYFQNAHLDVMTGVDYLIERGLVDPERMAKMGWSAGGHMTNKIITFTERFKAASSGAGAVNWVSMYGQSDVRIYRTPWFGGSPWGKDAPIDVYWEHSPLKYISKVTTPTIVLVGENDARVPMPQSVELYRALKENGVPTHLYVAPRAGHGWSELRHQLYKMNIELAWFEKHVMDREHTWETAPEAEEEEEKGATD